MTLSRKELIGHGDIKGYNVLVDIKKIEKENGKIVEKIEVFLIDFNLSLKIDPLNPVAKFDGGQPQLRAPELAQDHFTVKCDVYAFTQICLILLGVKDPFTKKSRAQSSVDYNARPFSFTNLMTRFEGELSDIPAPIKKYVTAFLHRMQSKIVAVRPDSNELLRFFTSVLHYIITYRSKPEINDTLIRHDATMALLATNLWKFCDSNLTIEQAKKIVSAYYTEDLNLSGLNSILSDSLLQLNLKEIMQNQLRQLSVNNYSSEIYTAFERVISSRQENLIEIASRLHKLFSFNHIQVTQFKLLLQFTLQHVPFSFSMVEFLIDHLTPLAALYFSVQNYCYYVLQPLAVKPVGYLAWLSGNNPAQDFEVVQKFLSECKLNIGCYPDLERYAPQELKLLYKGKVGTILDEHNQLLERFFEEQPEVYQAFQGYRP